MNLHESDFVGSLIENINFTHSDLSKSSFSNTTLKGVIFTGSNLDFVNWENATINGATALSEKHFAAVNLQNFGYRNENLAFKPLNRLRLRNINFNGANLEGTDFSESIMDDCNFTSARLSPLGAIQFGHRIPVVH